MPLIYANRSFSSITGYATADVMGRNCRWVDTMLGMSGDACLVGLVKPCCLVFGCTACTSLLCSLQPAQGRLAARRCAGWQQLTRSGWPTSHCTISCSWQRCPVQPGPACSLAVPDVGQSLTGKRLLPRHVLCKMQWLLGQATFFGQAVKQPAGSIAGCKCAVTGLGFPEYHCLLGSAGSCRERPLRRVRLTKCDTPCKPVSASSTWTY